MRFYNRPHQYYCGIDLHVKTMYVCILDATGQVLVHRNMPSTPEALLEVVAPYRDDLVVAAECMFTWYWLADVCAAEGILFVLGHALAMKAIHGGKAKNDKIDSQKIAVLLRGGITYRCCADCGLVVSPCVGLSPARGGCTRRAIDTSTRRKGAEPRNHDHERRRGDDGEGATSRMAAQCEVWHRVARSTEVPSSSSRVIAARRWSRETGSALLRRRAPPPLSLAAPRARKAQPSSLQPTAPTIHLIRATLPSRRTRNSDACEPPQPKSPINLPFLESSCGRLPTISQTEEHSRGVEQSNGALDCRWTDVHVSLSCGQVLVTCQLLNGPGTAPPSLDAKRTYGAAHEPRCEGRPGEQPGPQDAMRHFRCCSRPCTSRSRREEVGRVN